MIADRLMELRDDAYAEFQSKLIPGVECDRIIGVRVPMIRALAKKLLKESPSEVDSFIQDLPHRYYDENMLHAVLISETKGYEESIKRIDDFLPYVDNWAVCDSLLPKTFKKSRLSLMKKIEEWSASDKTYTCRFGIKMLMTHYLDEEYESEYLAIPAGIKSEEYYINMMIAWFYATALAKQWDDTIVYLENNALDEWVHNKAIQKARESYRIKPEQKEHLKSLRR